MESEKIFISIYIVLWMNYFDTIMMYLFSLTLNHREVKKSLFWNMYISLTLNLWWYHYHSEPTLISITRCGVRTWWSTMLVSMKNSSPLSEVRIAPFGPTSYSFTSSYPLHNLVIKESFSTCQKTSQVIQFFTWNWCCQCLPPSLLRDTHSSKVCR